MNRKYLIIAVAVLALGCIGTLQAFTHLETQEPQEIRGIVVDEYDVTWYDQQQTLWFKKAALEAEIAGLNKQVELLEEVRDGLKRELEMVNSSTHKKNKTAKTDSDKASV